MYECESRFAVCLQVRQLDWVEQVWPVHLKSQQTSPTNDLSKMMYPKVQKYVCVSVCTDNDQAMAWLSGGSVHVGCDETLLVHTNQWP